MKDINTLKKELEKAIHAAELNEQLDEYVDAYNNLISASDTCTEIAYLVLDPSEDKKYRDLHDELIQRAEADLDHSSLGVEAKQKMKKRKKSKNFAEFVGEEKIKAYLTEDVVKPWREHNMKSRATSAILLYGPEGASKSVLVNALITELDATKFTIEPSKLFSPYSADSIEEMKHNFAHAMEKDNVVFYFPEPVCFFSKEQNDLDKDTCKLMIKLLKKWTKQAKKANKNILFIASTSAPDKMSLKAFDKGLFDDLIRIHHPDRNTRKGVLVERMKGYEFENPEAIDQIVMTTHGYISKELSRLSRALKEASINASKDGKKAVITDTMILKVRSEFTLWEDVAFKNNCLVFEASLSEKVHLFDGK